MRKPNNKSYRKEKNWENIAMEKLKEAKLVAIVNRKDYWCVNPLMVAVNVKGMKRLCFYLSRCAIKVINAPMFKIKSIIAALQVIEKDDYMCLLDLKSVYMQIKVNENFFKYSGFCD